MELEIKIGNKSTTEYVLIGLNYIKKGVTKIIILARGKQINKAIDVCEIIRSQTKLKTININSGTETFENIADKMHISSIKIVIEI